MQLIKEIAVLDRDQVDGYREKLTQLAHWYIRGGNPAWNILNQEEGHRRISLPTYPFDHGVYWVRKHYEEFERGESPASNQIRGLVRQLRNGELSVSAAEVYMEEWQ